MKNKYDEFYKKYKMLMISITRKLMYIGRGAGFDFDDVLSMCNIQLLKTYDKINKEYNEKAERVFVYSTVYRNVETEIRNSGLVHISLHGTMNAGKKVKPIKDYEAIHYVRDCLVKGKEDSCINLYNTLNVYSSYSDLKHSKDYSTDDLKDLVRFIRNVFNGTKYSEENVELFIKNKLGIYKMCDIAGIKNVTKQYCSVLMIEMRNVLEREINKLGIKKEDLI